MARTSPVLTLSSTADPTLAFGYDFWIDFRVSAMLFSITFCSLVSMVRYKLLPGLGFNVTSSPTGRPRASTSTRLAPSFPRSSFSYCFSTPDLPIRLLILYLESLAASSS